MPVQVGLPEDQRGCRERDECSWCSLWSGRTTRSSTPVQKTPTTKHRPPLGWQQSKSSSRCLLVGIRPGRFVCRTSIPLVELSWILWGRNFHVKKKLTKREKSWWHHPRSKFGWPGEMKEKRGHRIPQPNLLQIIRMRRKKQKILYLDQT